MPKLNKTALGRVEFEVLEFLRLSREAVGPSGVFQTRVRVCASVPHRTLYIMDR